MGRTNDANLRVSQVEIAMVEVYMDEVYDLLEPRKKERQKLNVFNNKGEVFDSVDDRLLIQVSQRNSTS